MWERKGRKCGFQLPCAFFGLFGRKEIVGRLKMKSNQFMGVNRFSFVICGRGLGGFLVLVPLPLLSPKSNMPYEIIHQLLTKP